MRGLHADQRAARHVHHMAHMAKARQPAWSPVKHSHCHLMLAEQPCTDTVYRASHAKGLDVFQRCLQSHDTEATRITNRLKCKHWSLMDAGWSNKVNVPPQGLNINDSDLLLHLIHATTSRCTWRQSRQTHLLLSLSIQPPHVAEEQDVTRNGLSRLSIGVILVICFCGTVQPTTH